jgi:L-iditol 2-dehydrogenase
MKALLKTGPGPGGMACLEVDEPVPGPGELKIRVHACGICGTDMHIRRDEYPVSPPVIMGHEFSGTVAATGEGATAFKPGDRVVSMTSVHTCERCEYCFSGHRMLCPSRRSIGSGMDGAFAEYVKVPERLAFHVPPRVGLEAAAMCEPLACVVRGVIERSSVRAGDRVLVSGAGVIGQLAMQVARACGGIVVMAGVGRDAQRLGLAEKLGAWATIDVEKTSAADAAARLTDGRGFDVALECAGNASSADNCLRALKRTGFYTQIGLFGKPVPFDMDLALFKELNLAVSFATERSSWIQALRLLEHGLVDVAPLIGASVKLENWEEGFRRFEQQVDYKIFLVP